MTATYNPAEVERLVREAREEAVRRAATGNWNARAILLAMADQLEAARAEIMMLEKRPLRTFDQIAADRLADEVAVLVRRKVIDARSPAGDALLDYRDPPPSPRADRMASLERELEAARTRIAELEAAVERMAPVVAAAEAWRSPDSGGDEHDRLVGAVDAYRANERK